MAFGVQGLAVANRAFHQAKSYAAERVQGVPLDRAKGDTIQHHPDVMRLLASMRSEIEAIAWHDDFIQPVQLILADNKTGRV